MDDRLTVKIKTKCSVRAGGVSVEVVFVQEVVCREQSTSIWRFASADCVRYHVAALSTCCAAGAGLQCTCVCIYLISCQAALCDIHNSQDEPRHILYQAQARVLEHSKNG